MAPRIRVDYDSIEADWLAGKLAESVGELQRFWVILQNAGINAAILTGSKANLKEAILAAADTIEV